MTRRRIKPAPVPAWNYPPGYFLEPVYAWFGPDWQPATQWGRNDVAVGERATAAREVLVAQGQTGSISGLSRRSDARLAAVSMQVAALVRKVGRG